MEQYIVFTFVIDETNKTTGIQAAFSEGQKGFSPIVKDTFSMTVEAAKLGNLYFTFEDFMTKHPHAKVAYWGKFNLEKLNEICKIANGDLNSKDFINMQETFKNHLHMKRYVSFNDAFNKIAGIPKLVYGKDYEFKHVENMSYFIPYALGLKYFKRFDLKNK